MPPVWAERSHEDSIEQRYKTQHAHELGVSRRGAGMTVKLRVLEKWQIEKIYVAATEILDHTGAIIESDLALNLLRASGARVVDTGRVLIPPDLVEHALATVPSSVRIYDRLGDEAMVLGSQRSYFGAHGNCPQTLDFHTGKQREMTLHDIEESALVIDWLPNIDWINVMGVVKGVPPECADSVAFATVLQNTSKPIVTGFSRPESGRDVLEMAAAAVGGADALRNRPFLIIGDSSISPLYHPRDPIGAIIFAAQNGVPCLYNPMPQGGLSAPTTTAGVLAVTVAEVLTGLVVTQLAWPGAPFICGGVPSVFDMRDTAFVYGSPELFLMCSALTEIVHHFNLPSFGTAGVTNSKTVDVQAATEASLSCLMASLSRSNLIHDVGIVNTAVHSLPMVVLVDEIIGMVRGITEGIDVTSETLAVDVIDRVGPKGTFISEEHTLKHFRECWYPRLFDHSLAPVEHTGKPPIEERMKRYIDEALQGHHPAELPKSAQELVARYSSSWNQD